jgi:hypothetical protein
LPRAAPPARGIHRGQGRPHGALPLFPSRTHSAILRPQSTSRPRKKSQKATNASTVRRRPHHKARHCGRQERPPPGQCRERSARARPLQRCRRDHDSTCEDAGASALRGAVVPSSSCLIRTSCRTPGSLVRDTRPASRRSGRVGVGPRCGRYRSGRAPLPCTSGRRARAQRQTRRTPPAGRVPPGERPAAHRTECAADTSARRGTRPADPHSCQRAPGMFMSFGASALTVVGGGLVLGAALAARLELRAVSARMGHNRLASVCGMLGVPRTRCRSRAPRARRAVRWLPAPEAGRARPDVLRCHGRARGRGSRQLRRRARCGEPGMGRATWVGARLRPRRSWPTPVRRSRWEGCRHANCARCASCPGSFSSHVGSRWMPRRANASWGRRA